MKAEHFTLRMVSCSTCGREIQRDMVNIGSEGAKYHLTCAPDKLIQDAMTEWNAIVAKGVRYFVLKFVPAETRPSRYSDIEGSTNPSSGYSNLFVEAGEALRVEAGRRTGPKQS